jgi:hypothetical protein
VCFLLHGAHLFKLFGRVESVIGLPCLQKKVHVFLIEREAFRLDIRSPVSSHPGSLVVFQTRPLKGRNEVFHGPIDKARAIRIFDAENELAAVASGEKVVVERGAKAADVKVAGGTGGKSNSNFRQRSSVERLGGQSL